MDKNSCKPLFPLGFNDNIYLEGNARFFSLLDIKNRKRRSHGKRKKNKKKKKKHGNFKRKHKTILSLSELHILLKSGRHQMLSKLSSLSVSSLRKLDE